MIAYTVEIINDQTKLKKLVDQLSSVSLIALDIETINWWNRHQERISLIQFAFKTGNKVKVSIIDALADLDITDLRSPLELKTITKIVHNAAFDATRLLHHYEFKAAPLYDTMLAARRNKERRYSLAAQAQIHLNLRIDKRLQTSDWSRRPLDLKQINYAALDVFSTLLLYDNQITRNLNGFVQIKNKFPSQQSTLPLIDFIDSEKAQGLPIDVRIADTNDAETAPLRLGLTSSSLALLGIINELPSRYYPEQLAVSVGSEQRIGIAGWILDNRIGRDTDLDEETAKLEIIDLLERGLIRLTETRRLEASEEGQHLWHRSKNN